MADPSNSLTSIWLHVAEAEARVARQKVLLQTLSARKDPLVPVAEKVLSVLRESLIVSLEHARRLERGAGQDEVRR